jgi:hypothetical protein
LATDVDIANFALGHLGDRRITALDEASEAAEACNLWFTTARRRALKAGDWTSASKRVAGILPDATAPAFGFNNRYQLPADFLRLISVNNSGIGREYNIESGFLLTDYGPTIDIVYIFDQTDVSKFDEELVQFMALTLAFYTCMKLTQSKNLRADLRENLEREEVKARNINAAGQSPQPLEPGSWIQGRFGGVPDRTKWYG